MRAALAFFRYRLRRWAFLLFGRDDTATLQYMIDQASKHGGKVYLPPGTYCISSPIHWP